MMDFKFTVLRVLSNKLSKKKKKERKSKEFLINLEYSTWLYYIAYKTKN